MFMFMGPNKTELNYVEIFMKHQNHPFAKLPRHQIVFCAQGQGLHLQGPGALTQQLCHNLPGFLRSVQNWDII